MQARVCKRVVELSRAPRHHQCMGSELEVEHSRINCVQTALAERTRDGGEIRKKAGPPHDFREFVSIRAAVCARVRVCVTQVGLGGARPPIVECPRLIA